MTNPKITKPIAITCASATDNSYVRAYNRTTGEVISTRTLDGKALIDSNNSVSGFTTGDVLEIIISGGYTGSNTVTLTSDAAGPQTVTVTMTASSTTNAPAINF